MFDVSEEDLKRKIAEIDALKELMQEKIKNVDIETFSVEKQSELFYVSKFLCHEAAYTVEEVTESPDFILRGLELKIGLEVSILVDSKKKQEESFKAKLVKAAQEIFKTKYQTDGFLANVYLKQDRYQFAKSDIPRFALQVAEEIYQFYENSHTEADDAKFVADVAICKFDEVEFVYNPGGYMVTRGINNHLHKLIAKKETLLHQYFHSQCDEYWLLVVTTNTSPDSFGIDEESLLQFSASTRFDRLYILEHFKNKLYRIV